MGKITIIGSGINGLLLGYYLSPQHQVTIYEKCSYPGGLAAGFKADSWQWSIDNFYHHFFSSDQEFINLLKELKLPYFFKTPLSANFQKGQIFPFDCPRHLLSHPYLTWPAKLRTGFALAALKLLPHSVIPADQSAADFYPKLMGQAGWQTLWQPLMEKKFSSHWQKVNSTWLWARIKKRSKKLGYIQGGFQALINCLINRIKANGGEIYLNHPITNLDQIKADQIIIATSAAQAEKTLLTNNLFSTPTYVSALNLILVTKQPILNDIYWLNVYDRDIPFVAAVAHTNFVESRYYNQHHLTYLGGYYSPDHPLMKASKEKVWQQFRPGLKKIAPAFETKDLKKLYLSKYRFAQPITPPHRIQIIPPTKLNSRLALCCMEQIYPWDRGLNNAIPLVKKTLNKIALTDKVG